MLKIVNKTSGYLHDIGGVSIAPYKSVEIEMAYVPFLRSLERNGIISVSEVTHIDEPVTIKELPNEEVIEMTEEDIKDETEEKNEAPRKRYKK